MKIRRIIIRCPPRKIAVQDQPGQKVNETPSQPTNQTRCHTSEIPAMQDVEVGGLWLDIGSQSKTQDPQGVSGSNL
jgi:hypothetical protein